MASLRKMLVGAVVAGLVAVGSAVPVKRQAAAAPAKLSDIDILQLYVLFY
jgi:hypothetical protein